MPVIDSGGTESLARTKYGKRRVDKVRCWARYLDLTSYETI